MPVHLSISLFIDKNNSFFFFFFLSPQ